MKVFSQQISPLVKTFELLIIESTNIYNLRCKICPVNTIMTRRKGFIDFKNYRH